MKISCPTCSASGTIPDHEIPEGGRIITCPRCRTEFAVLSDGNDTAAVGNGTQEITASLLGLDELDTVTRKIPDVFIALKGHDPVDEHRQAVSRALPKMTIDKQEQLVSFLTAMSASAAAKSVTQATEIILLTQDELFSHAVTAVSNHENLFVFVTDEENGLDIVIEQSLGRDPHPILVIDTLHDNDCTQTLSFIRQKVSAYPQISVLITACFHTWRAISMDGLETGVDLVLPRPCRICHEDFYVQRLITFLSGSGSLDFDRSLFQCLRESGVKKSLRTQV